MHPTLPLEVKYAESAAERGQRVRAREQTAATVGPPAPTPATHPKSLRMTPGYLPLPWS